MSATANTRLRKSSATKPSDNYAHMHWCHHPDFTKSSFLLWLLTCMHNGFLLCLSLVGPVMDYSIQWNFTVWLSRSLRWVLNLDWDRRSAKTWSHFFFVWSQQSLRDSLRPNLRLSNRWDQSELPPQLIWMKRTRWVNPLEIKFAERKSLHFLLSEK